MIDTFIEDQVTFLIGLFLLLNVLRIYYLIKIKKRKYKIIML